MEDLDTTICLESELFKVSQEMYYDFFSDEFKEQKIPNEEKEKLILEKSVDQFLEHVKDKVNINIIRLFYTNQYINNQEIKILCNSLNYIGNIHLIDAIILAKQNRVYDSEFSEKVENKKERSTLYAMYTAGEREHSLELTSIALGSDYFVNYEIMDNLSKYRYCKVAIKNDQIEMLKKFLGDFSEDQNLNQNKNENLIQDEDEYPNQDEDEYPNQDEDEYPNQDEDEGDYPNEDRNQDEKIQLLKYSAEKNATKCFEFLCKHLDKTYIEVFEEIISSDISYEVFKFIYEYIKDFDNIFNYISYRSNKILEFLATKNLYPEKEWINDLIHDFRFLKDKNEKEQILNIFDLYVDLKAYDDLFLLNCFLLIPYHQYIEKYLNKVEPNDESLLNACLSLNVDMVQKIIDKGVYPTEKIVAQCLRNHRKHDGKAIPNAIFLLRNYEIPLDQDLLTEVIAEDIEELNNVVLNLSPIITQTTKEDILIYKNMYFVEYLVETGVPITYHDILVLYRQGRISVNNDVLQILSGNIQLNKVQKENLIEQQFSRNKEARDIISLIEIN